MQIENLTFDLLPYAFIPNEKWTEAQKVAEKEKESEPDDIIHAYKEGVAKGLSTEKQVLADFFKYNLEKAFGLGELLWSELNGTLNLPTSSMYMKVNNIKSFDLLFVVDSSAYLTDSRKHAFSRAREIKKENNNTKFGLDFIFLSGSEEVNEEVISSEGFTFSYEPPSS